MRFKSITLIFATVFTVLVSCPVYSYSWSWGAKNKKEEPKKVQSKSKSSAEQKLNGPESPQTSLEAIAQQLRKEPDPGNALENVQIPSLVKTQRIYVPRQIVPKPFTPVKVNESKDGKNKTVTTVTGSTQSDPDSDE